MLLVEGTEDVCFDLYRAITSSEGSAERQVGR